MKKLIALLTVVGIGATVAYQITKPENLIKDRVWIERLPRDQRDLVLHFVMVQQQPGKPGGALIRASQWRQLVEAFRWRSQGNVLELGFPQENQRVRLKTRAWRCKGEAPKPFELCLTLSHGNDTLTLYSRDEWKIRDGETVQLPEGPEVHLPVGLAEVDLDGLPLGAGPLRF